MTSKPTTIQIRLRPGEQRALELRAAHPDTRVRVRAAIVLACVAGKTNAAIGRELGISPREVGRWRQAFIGARLKGLDDDPRAPQSREARRESGERLLGTWQRALSDLEHDRIALGVSLPVTAASLRAVEARVSACRLVPQIGGKLDIAGTLALFEAAAAARDPSGFAEDLPDFAFGDAVLPDEAASLLALVEAAQRSRGRRVIPAPAKPPAPQPPPGRALVVEAVTPDRIRRVPPDPRLTEDDETNIAFADLPPARDDDE